MKILIDPKLSILIQDFSDADCAELLRCIFNYPNRDCELGLWKYMKDQIDIDAQKYKEKCERMAANRQGRHTVKTSVISDMKTEQISDAIKVKEENKINKYNSYCKESERSNGQESVERPVNNFVIHELLSTAAICKINPKFQKYLDQYPPAVIERAEKTLIKKRLGQVLTIVQILEWIEQENAFYIQNHKGEV